MVNEQVRESFVIVSLLWNINLFEFRLPDKLYAEFSIKRIFKTLLKLAGFISMPNVNLTYKILAADT